jgi:NADPH:quinone reductase-like Zn-dependent oxidoreductase
MGMTAMRAIVVREHGSFDRLLIESRPVPAPGPGEVAVAIAAVGLNHLDTWVRRGVPGHKFPLSCDGTAAERIVVPAANVVRKPGNLTMPQAASFALVFLTAWNMLVRRCELRAGETVLVHAGLSGVGSAAVQIARLLGANVIATAGGAAKCAKVRELGADHVIDHQTQDFAAEVRRLTGKAGVQIVFEHVGAATWEGSLKCLARGGRLVTCGATTGGNVQVSLHALFFKSLSLLGSTMGSKGDLHRIVDLVAAGRLRPVLAHTLPFDQVGEAHRMLEQRTALGKIALAV